MRATFQPAVGRLGPRARPDKSLGFCLALIFTGTLWLLTTACMDGALEWGQVCFSSEECPSDQRCINNICTEVPDFEVDVEVIPTTTSDHLPYSVRAVDLESRDGLLIEVPPPTIVRGQIVLGPEAYLGSSRLSFAAEINLRRSPRYTIEVRGDGEQASTFELKLVGTLLDAGRTEAIPYSVTATPNDTRACCLDGGIVCPAPVTLAGMKFRTDTEDLVLAFPNEPTRILGRVATLGEDLVPWAGVRVQAWSATGGIHSAAAETNESGEFCLAIGLPKAEGEMPVRVRVSPTTTGPPIPTMDFELPAVAGQTIPDLLLDVGDIGRTERLDGMLLDRMDEPIEGAQISFNGAVSSGGTYSVTALSDPGGKFAVDLFPGTYQIRALPPATSAAAVTDVSDFVIGGASTGSSPFASSLPNRPSLSGRIVGPSVDRAPIADLEVIALADSASSTGGVRIERFTTQTDENGDFTLLLDPGTYRLHFRPPWSTGLPWMVSSREHIEPGVSRELGSLVLEEASLFDGKALGEISGGQTVPLAGARVEVHARRHEESYLLWEGRAEDDGTFQVVLPRSLTSRVETTKPREPDPDDSW